MRYPTFKDRPECFELTTEPHPLKDGLVFAGLGRHPGSTLFHDSSLYGNRGTLVSALWQNQIGRPAVNFDSSNYATIPNNVAFTTGSNFTVSLWLYARTVAAAANKRYWIFSKSSAGGNYEYELSINSYTVPNSYDFRIYQDAGSVYLTARGGTPVVNAWVHVLCSFVVGVRNDIYINGALTAYDDTIAGTVEPTKTGNLMIGERLDGADDLLDGLIADLGIWSRILSLSEIRALADPSNVMLSLGGSDLLRYRRKWWPVGAAAGAITLVVANSQCVVSSQNASLTQHQALTVANSSAVVSSGNVALTQHQALTVANSQAVVSSQAAALTQHHALAVQNSQAVVASESPSLTQHQALAVQDSACVVESQNAALTQHHALIAQASQVVVSSQSPELTQHQALTAQNSAVVVASENVTLTHHPLGAELLILEHHSLLLAI
jgi:hypothetical protein